MSEDVGSVEIDAGSSGGDWRASLSDDIRHDPSLASIQDVNGLAKSFIHGQKMVGADKVVLPKEDASPEEMNEFYNRLGRPEKYEISRPDLPQGLESVSYTHLTLPTTVQV